MCFWNEIHLDGDSSKDFQTVDVIPGLWILGFVFFVIFEFLIKEDHLDGVHPQDLQYVNTIMAKLLRLKVLNVKVPYVKEPAMNF